MKLAVSSSGKDLDAQIDPRFGRCAYFLLVDTDTMDYEALDNESGALGGGAGIQAAQMVASQKAGAVITGHCGPNAVQALNAGGLEIYAGQGGTVREAVERYKRGELESTSEPTVSDHYGMGGRGGGRGRGMAQRPGTGRGSQEPNPGGADEIERLRAQARGLRSQIEAMESTIEKLSQK